MAKRKNTTISDRKDIIPEEHETTPHEKLRKTVVWWLQRRPVRYRVFTALLLAAIFLVVTPHQGLGTLDKVVACLSYSLWFVVCVPKLLVYLNPAFVSQAVGVIVKVFYIEILVICYASLRGHESLVLNPVASLASSLCFPPNIKGEDLGWLGQVGYNLRIVTLISCGIISTISYVLDYLHSKM